MIPPVHLRTIVHLATGIFDTRSNHSTYEQISEKFGYNICFCHVHSKRGEKVIFTLMNGQFSMCPGSHACRLHASMFLNRFEECHVPPFPDAVIVVRDLVPHVRSHGNTGKRPKLTCVALTLQIKKCNYMNKDEVDIDRSSAPHHAPHHCKSRDMALVIMSLAHHPCHDPMHRDSVRMSVLRCLNRLIVNKHFEEIVLVTLG